MKVSEPAQIVAKDHGSISSWKLVMVTLEFNPDQPQAFGPA